MLKSSIIHLLTTSYGPPLARNYSAFSANSAVTSLRLPLLFPIPPSSATLSPMERILDEQQIRGIIASLAAQIAADASLKSTADNPVALVGIRSRGELIAERVATELQRKLHLETIDVGALDITMYRDDLS